MRKLFILVILCACALADHAQSASPASNEAKGLKDYYKNYFPIGVAVSPRALRTDEAQLILDQFNSMTPENAMKMGPIHPTEKEYNWAGADSIAAFAKRNGLKLRGHTLCWHNQAPRWFFTDTTGKPVSKEVLLARLKDHITTVVSRYKGIVYAWDVANEVIADAPEDHLRCHALVNAIQQLFDEPRPDLGGSQLKRTASVELMFRRSQPTPGALRIAEHVLTKRRDSSQSDGSI